LANVFAFLWLALAAWPLGIETGFGQVPAETSLEGEVQVLAVDERDDAGHWRHRLEYFLQTETKRVRLEMMETPGQLPRPNARIRVSGVRVGNDLRVSQMSILDSLPRSFYPAAQANVTTGSQPTLVALLNFRDLTVQPFTTGEIQNRVVLNPDSTDRFLRENSYGKLWLDVDVLDWKTMGISYTEIGGGCSVNSDKLLEEALKILGPSVNLHDYSRLILVFPHLPLGGLCGLGSVGTWTIQTPLEGEWTASVAWIDGDCAVSSTVAHEFGHNLGFGHASSLAGLGENILDPSHPFGAWNEYGDGADTMGTSSSFLHFSSVRKAQARWLSETNVMNVTSSGDYVLEQLEQPSGGVKALTIPVGVNGSGNPVGYWIDYRKPAGAFATSDAVQIRLFSDSFFDCTDNSPHSVRFTSLELPGAIKGRVTNSEGSGIPGVSVRCYDSAWNPLGLTSTDITGDYLLAGIRPGTAYVGTSNTLGYVDEFYQDARDLSTATPATVTSGTVTSSIDFKLNLGASVSGRITRDADGTGISDVVVNVYDSAGYWVAASGSNRAGWYSVANVPEGNVYLRVTNNQGYIDEYYDNALSLNSATPVGVTAGMDTTVNFQLTIGGSVSGRVVRDSDGQGVPNIEVSAANSQFYESATTDVTGQYTVRGLPGGLYYVGTFHDGDLVDEYFDNSPASATATLVTVALGAQTSNINFSLGLGGTVSGRVIRDSDGQGIAGIYVDIYDSSWRYLTSPNGFLGILHGQGGLARHWFCRDSQSARLQG